METQIPDRFDPPEMFPKVFYFDLSHGISEKLRVSSYRFRVFK
jgi:hypothetical protein